MDKISCDYSARKISNYLSIFCLFWAYFESYKTGFVYMGIGLLLHAVEIKISGQN